MMVTFVSECEKKALPKTRRVLDAFANRIGSRTWQTVITNEGLVAVKKLLRKTASKNTAVSCHWIRSRSRSELVWVVGSRGKFNGQGFVPVNLTNTDIEQYQDKAQWKVGPLIQYAAAIAGLFHDFGKANKLFQDKINPSVASALFEPYRHEWVSMRLFQTFVGNNSDNTWLEELADVKTDAIPTCFCDGIDGGITEKNNPLLVLPPFARLVAWIILTHHRLPMVPSWQDNTGPAPLAEIEHWLSADYFDADWNSYRCKDEDQQERIKDNWHFAEETLPYYSSHWRAKACTTASEAKQELALWLNEGGEQDFINDHLFTSHLARLSMMLADHHYSSRPKVTQKWRNPSYKVYANSDRKTKQLKQQLDEHLIGVACHAQRIVRKLPRLKQDLTKLEGNAFLTDLVGKKDIDLQEKYGWQDKAVKEARKVAEQTLEHGFFGINMASTGKGKTLANAKIMYALGESTNGVRFNVALGLRTLTLQTGREFRDQLDLNDEQLAILVGGTAVKQLFESSQHQVGEETEQEAFGSESEQEVLPDEFYVHYSGATKKHPLSTWTKDNPKLDGLLCAPVLVSTIDHLIPATEGIRGGKQIGPMLRLLTSDLVLDEPDDFGLKDLPALCRLVHWAGMLGSRVLLSTATMPPALAKALFQAYKAGWAQYAKANIQSWNGEVCCAWFDEFSANSVNISQFNDKALKGLAAKALYVNAHKGFVADRLTELAENSTIKRKGSIVYPDNDLPFSTAIAQLCHQKMQELHQQHGVSRGGKTVSIGLVRMANINPLVAVARELLAMMAPENTCIHYCVYHSRYPLAIRSFIENRLDTVLSRKQEDEFWAREEITQPLNQYPHIDYHIFVVLASPVAEVGRDHDYDWAIVEPSSMRSIIQLAGRILRHRELKEPLSHANILLLNQNIKALKDESGVCFEKPGFESQLLRVVPHALEAILPEKLYRSIDAKPRIEEPPIAGKRVIPKGGKRPYEKYTELNVLEHRALIDQLLQGEERARYWWSNRPHWCGEVQNQQRFRDSKKDEAYYLFVHGECRTEWQWLNESDRSQKSRAEKFGDAPNLKKGESLTLGKHSCLWFDIDPFLIYSELEERFGIDLPEVSRRFGEARITEYGAGSSEYFWHEALGIYQEVDE